MTKLYHHQHSPQNQMIEDAQKERRLEPQGKTYDDYVRNGYCPWCGTRDGMGYVSEFAPLPDECWVDDDKYLRHECGYCRADSGEYDRLTSFGQLGRE